MDYDDHTMFIKTVKPVGIGEELTINYSMVNWNSKSQGLV